MISTLLANIGLIRQPSSSSPLSVASEPAHPALMTAEKEAPAWCAQGPYVIVDFFHTVDRQSYSATDLLPLRGDEAPLTVARSQTVRVRPLNSQLEHLWQIEPFVEFRGFLSHCRHGEIITLAMKAAPADTKISRAQRLSYTLPPALLAPDSPYLLDLFLLFVTFQRIRGS